MRRPHSLINTVHHATKLSAVPSRLRDNALKHFEAERREPSGEFLPLTHRRACALPLPRSSKTNIPSWHCQPISNRRSGKMLIQVMVYLTLMSSLLGLGALCLHAAFRVDEVDLKDSLLLRSLVRCEQRLRDDNRTGRRSGTNQSATFQVESATKMILALPEDRQIEWESHRGVLTRRVLEQGSLRSTDRFAFPAGSSIEFQTDAAGGVLVRIHEPSPVVVYAKAADGSTHPSKPDSVATPTAPDGATVPRFIEIQLRGAP